MASPALTSRASARREPTNDRVRVIAKIVEASGDELLGQIGGLEMEGGLDAEEIGGGILESRAGTERSAQDRRTRGDIGKLAADAHDFPGIRDSAEIVAARRGPAPEPSFSGEPSGRRRGVRSASVKPGRRYCRGWNR